MFNRYVGLLKKDILNSYRNYFFIGIIIIALFYALIINFVIPEEIKQEQNFYVYLEGEIPDLQSLKGTIKIEDSGLKYFTVLHSREDVIAKMEEDHNSLGMVIKMYNNKPVIEFIFQGFESEKIRNTMILAIKDQFLKQVSKPVQIETVQLSEGNIPQIPINKNVLPLFILTEPSMLGFTLILALILIEKEDGTIKAYNVSPGGVPEYLASKISLMVILGIISALLSSLLVVGFDANYFYLLPIIILGGIFFSALGLIVAAFYRNISQAMIIVIVANIILSLPAVSYYMPSFSPFYIKILPTYSLLFAIREAIFPTGNTAIITSTLFLFLTLSIGAYLLSIILYKRNVSND